MCEMPPSVAIVGGGLVGSLAACMFAKKGWKVDVFEMREDIRQLQFVHGRSINLALSTRGRNALAVVGLEQTVLEQGIPMPARYVHEKDGKHGYAVPYGKPGQYIVSINRRLLNEIMLSEAERTPNVKIHFQHKVMNIEFGEESNDVTLVFQKQPEGIEVRFNADLIIASDGAGSTIRRNLLTRMNLDYSQEYIPHGYLEFVMPASREGTYAMPPNFFHLWPRGELCLIALANKDSTYTVTLFAPFTRLSELRTTESIIAFFQTNFPDALTLLGKDEILSVFARVKPGAMVSVKCSPHNYKDKIVLLGDAAHAMVPFYGQGMNCGFEDCMLLYDLLSKHRDEIGPALTEYSKLRVIDAHTICDLAMYNYQELRFLVTHKTFQLRKKVDAFLNQLFPKTWIPLYSMVTFSQMRYHEIVKCRKWQDKVINRVWSTVFVCGLVGTAFAVWKAGRAGKIPVPVINFTRT